VPVVLVRQGRAAFEFFPAGDQCVAEGLARLRAAARRPANNARFVYLDSASRDFFTDWDRAADDIAAMPGSEAVLCDRQIATTSQIVYISHHVRLFSDNIPFSRINLKASAGTPSR
jgi:hypothetical protein